MNIPVIYKDSLITITKEFIYLPNGERESIRIDRISEIKVTREQIGDYKAGAILFFIIGIVTVWFLIGILFLVLGVAAWNTKIYSYKLLTTVEGADVRILLNKRKGYVKDIARTIHGLAFSKTILTR